MPFNDTMSLSSGQSFVKSLPTICAPPQVTATRYFPVSRDPFFVFYYAIREPAPFFLIAHARVERKRDRARAGPGPGKGLCWFTRSRLLQKN